MNMKDIDDNWQTLTCSEMNQNNRTVLLSCHLFLFLTRLEQTLKKRVSWKLIVNRGVELSMSQLRSVPECAVCTALQIGLASLSNGIASFVFSLFWKKSKGDCGSPDNLGSQFCNNSAEAAPSRHAKSLSSTEAFTLCPVAFVEDCKKQSWVKLQSYDSLWTPVVESWIVHGSVGWW